MVETWPHGGWVLGLVPDPADPEWVGGAALELIRAAADHRRPALVLDLAPETSDLGVRFDAVGADGFAEAAAGDAELSEIARRDEDRGVAYLPGGRRTAGADLADSAALSALADRIRRVDGVLLVVLDREGARAAASAGWPDGWVLVGDAEAAAGGEPLPGDLPELGRIEPREEPDTPEAGRWRRHREEASFPTWKVAGGVLLLLALAGAWWWYAERATSALDDGVDPSSRGAIGPEPAADSPAAEAGVPDSAPAGGATDETPTGADTVGAAGSGRIRPDPARTGAAGRDGDPARGERPLGYSVLIASYASADDARQRVRRLSSREEGLYFVAPTPVQESVWHRVYAGSLPDRTAAEALMERLVEAGAKDEARAWDVRPVPWSFRLSTGFGNRAAAADRARELHDRGLPAYVLPAGDVGSYHVYSGAFESRDDAVALRSRLQEAGVEAELVRRTGTSP